MQNEKSYIIYTKIQHKKSNKIKKRCWQGEQDMLLSYCRKGKKTKIEIESETEIKMG